MKFLTRCIQLAAALLKLIRAIQQLLQQIGDMFNFFV